MIGTRRVARYFISALMCSGLLLGLSSALARVPVNPEEATGWTEKSLSRANEYMISAANPHASEAGLGILDAGGSAVDAAIAAQLVLSLVEPQSSGLGGGGFMVVFDAASQRLRTYDARETAPQDADNRYFRIDGEVLPFWDAVNSGLSVGAPGLLRGLEKMHADGGKLPWASLFEPAIRLAREGFAVSPRLNGLLQRSEKLRESKTARPYFYDANGNPRPVGYVLKNPALADVLEQVSRQGADAFYESAIAHDIVSAVRSHPTPGALSLPDLVNYEAVPRQPLCVAYLEYELCGIGPPSSGPVTVMQILLMLTHTDILDYAPNSLEAVHLFAEAGKLACADRDVYIADPDFSPFPVDTLLDADYIAGRAALINPSGAMSDAQAGNPLGQSPGLGRDRSPELPSTTHLSVVDASGNVVSMTTSVESAFGSKIMVRGFLLNNQLTDFSLDGTDEAGMLVANGVEPGKRPRSSMAPMIVLRDGKPYMAIGAPGGPFIISFVAKTLLGVLGWGLDIQSAIALPNRGSCSYGTEIEEGTELEALATPLEQMGHEVRLESLPSGLQGIVITPDGVEGGADPRREGVALGR
ncbi:MAG TPA: gamma-glutamyltransferase [Pusillimonas sp.]|nr:gamma-glutamyltransferase [Pusillimonas sp.]